MIIGSGQIAQAFSSSDKKNAVFFASGVANSNCKDNTEFKREETLLKKHLEKSRNKKFVYFSSCALSAKNYRLNEYYQHKLSMEEFIKTHFDNYYIFRIPQLIGDIFKEHNTLFNFLYHKIITDELFYVFKNAYRYVIEINDAKCLINKFITKKSPQKVIDIANPYRYSAFEIVSTLEDILDKKANYKVLDKSDGYYLNLQKMNTFINQYGICVDFSKNYLEKKLREKLI